MTELEVAQVRIWQRHGNEQKLSEYTDSLKTSVALQVERLIRLAIMRVDDAGLTGHSTMNGQIQAALATTTFRSQRTTLTAFGGDMTASITHIVDCLAKDTGRRSNVALTALTSVPAHLAARVLAESVGERMLGVEHLLGLINPMSLRG